MRKLSYSSLTSSSKGGVFPFELEQFLICEEVGRVREFLHLLVEYLHLFRAFLGFRFQAFLLSDSEESSDSCDEDDDGYVWNFVLNEATVSPLFLEGVELFGIFVAYYYLMR